MKIIENLQLYQLQKDTIEMGFEKEINSENTERSSIKNHRI